MISKRQWQNIKKGDILVDNEGDKRPVIDAFPGGGMNNQGGMTVKVKTKLDREHEHRYLTLSGGRRNFTKVIKKHNYEENS